MKLRHAAALALTGWYLTFYLGKTVPKDCANCAVDLGQMQMSVVGVSKPLTTQMSASSSELFETESDCAKAGNAGVQAFSANADKSGERVLFPSRFRCTEHKSK